MTTVLHGENCLLCKLLEYIYKHITSILPQSPLKLIFESRHLSAVSMIYKCFQWYLLKRLQFLNLKRTLTDYQRAVESRVTENIQTLSLFDTNSQCFRRAIELRYFYLKETRGVQMVVVSLEGQYQNCQFNLVLPLHTTPLTQHCVICVCSTFILVGAAQFFQGEFFFLSDSSWNILNKRILFRFPQRSGKLVVTMSPSRGTEITACCHHRPLDKLYEIESAFFYLITDLWLRNNIYCKRPLRL